MFCGKWNNSICLIHQFWEVTDVITQNPSFSEIYRINVKSKRKIRMRLPSGIRIPKFSPCVRMLHHPDDIHPWRPLRFRKNPPRQDNADSGNFLSFSDRCFRISLCRNPVPDEPTDTASREEVSARSA